MSVSNEQQAKIFNIEFDTYISSSANQVWNLLAFGINEWWMQDFRAIPDSTVSLDLRAGGMLMESGTNGQLLEWYKIQMIVPGESVYLIGHLAPDWGGPTISMLKLSLKSKGNGCVLSVSDSLLGNIDDAKATTIDEGWQLLFGTSLKKYSESVQRQ